MFLQHEGEDGTQWYYLCPLGHTLSYMQYLRHPPPQQ
jgi:hypothetical protein